MLNFFEIKKRGFTLVELIFVIAIIIILLLISLVVLFSEREKSYLGNNAQGVINVLRLARNKTIASEQAISYGVHFDKTSSPNRYILFKGQRGTSDDIIFELSRPVKFKEINLTSDDVIFSRVTGAATPAGNIKLGLISDPSQTITIYIDASGKIDFATTAPIPSPDPRVSDSRHVHFNLGWSIQNATTLKFFFPATGQTVTVDMANYFNADKTNFDWSGSFIVPAAGGTEQKFRIHTHLLSDTNTILSITRDRNNGKNDKEVSISIDEKEIAHYQDGTVTQGLWVNTMEIQ